jgi:hypothetical protein
MSALLRRRRVLEEPRRAAGDGDAKDGDLCVRPVTLTSGRKLPKCVDMIEVGQVIGAVERYLEFGGERSG